MLEGYGDEIVLFNMRYIHPPCAILELVLFKGSEPCQRQTLAASVCVHPETSTLNTTPVLLLFMNLTCFDLGFEDVSYVPQTHCQTSHLCSNAHRGQARASKDQTLQRRVHIVNGQERQHWVLVPAECEEAAHLESRLGSYTHLESSTVEIRNDFMLSPRLGSI